MNTNRGKVCCFIVPKISVLWLKLSEGNQELIDFKNIVKIEAEKAIQRGFNIFLFSLESGVDLICAEAVLELKEKYPKIKLIGFINCDIENYYLRLEIKNNYISLLNKLDSIRFIDGGYTVDRELEENYAMIDNSSLAIVMDYFFKGEIYNLLNYANNQGVEVILKKGLNFF